MEFKMLWAKVVAIALFFFGVFLMGTIPACCTVDTHRGKIRPETRLAHDTNRIRFTDLAESAVAFVRNGEIFCTGNIIATQETHSVLTSAAHCFRTSNLVRQMLKEIGLTPEPDQRKVEVWLRNGTHTVAFLVGVREKHDVAVLVMPPHKLPKYPKFCGKPKLYTKVFMVGHPAGMRWIATWGVLSSLNGSKNPYGGYQYVVSMVSFFGNSGGLIVDGDMCAVGILSRILLAQSFYSYAVPYEHLSKFLVDMRPKIQTTVQKHFVSN